MRGDNNSLTSQQIFSSGTSSTVVLISIFYVPYLQKSGKFSKSIISANPFSLVTMKLHKMWNRFILLQSTNMMINMLDI